MRFFHPRVNHLSSWHSWYAWYPVRLNPGDGSAQPVVWLEWIERRVEFQPGFFDIAKVKFYRSKL